MSLSKDTMSETDEKEMKSSGRKILVVEDETDLREALREALTAEGFEVLEAKDGTAALKFAFEEKPDLILLDLMLPYMSGHEVLKKLREDKWGRYAKVIVLSALEDIDTVSEVLEYGAHEYLVKSDWKLEDIVKRVKERLA